MNRKALAATPSPAKALTKQLKGIAPLLIRLRAQNHRIFFRDQGHTLKIGRVLDCKEACP